MGVPGKRAPTVQECDSDKPFEPLAMRQHALGPYPIDPNLISQGVPPDDRVDFGDNIFGPVKGTPMPPGAAPAPTPPDTAPPPPADSLLPPPADAPLPPAPEGDVPTAAPSAFVPNGSGPGPSVAIAHYDPQTGEYATPDGRVYQQTDVIDAPKKWQDLVFKVGQ
jgi:hypothetical protein